MNLFWTSFLITGGLKCSRAQFGPWVLEVLPSDESDGAEWQVFEDGHKAAFDVAEDPQSAKLTAEAWLKERVHDIRAYAKRKALQPDQSDRIAILEAENRELKAKLDGDHA